MMLKPITIFDADVDSSCAHMMLRIDNRKQIRYVTKFVFRIIKKKPNQNEFTGMLNSIFKLSKWNTWHGHITEKGVVLDYLVIDEGKGKSAFIFLSITTSKLMFKLFRNFNHTDYFEP
jgi:hypothetical protein